MPDQKPRLAIRLSIWVSLSALLTSLALVGNYVLVIVPNVELGTTVLFYTAYSFDPLMGVWSAFMMSIIFSSFNPWGGMVPLIWVAQLIGWVYTSLAGGILGRSEKTKRWELAIAAIVCTLVFDMATNIAYSISFNIPLPLALLTGLPYSIVHIVSNLLLFPTVVPAVRKGIREAFAGMIWLPTGGLGVSSEE